MIQNKVKKYRGDYSLENDSTAFSWLSLETILNLNSDDIEDSITDGAMDGGIDALYIGDRTIHIFTFKYTDIFEHTSNNFPANDLDKILITAQGIYEHTIARDDVNELLWEKVNEIWDLFSKGPLNFNFYVCSNKLKPVKTARDKFETKLISFRFVKFFYIDQEDLASKILEQRYEHVDGSLTFIDKQHFERSDGNVRGIVATVAASDLINLVADPSDPKKINENVFNDNVRVYKRRNRINKRIIETALSDDNYKFWYLNNGITIVCEECDYIPNTRSPRANLQSLQIVNGGQTTHALFEAYQENNEKINDILLLMRVCVTKRDNPIAERISETTNSQIPVTTRDLHANDNIQRKLQEEFDSLGYYYERKPNQFQSQPANKRLNNELLAQLYLAYFFNMPSQAKNKKSIVFGEKYDEIFDPQKITATRMLLPYRLYLPLKIRRETSNARKEIKSQLMRLRLMSPVQHFIY